MTDYGFIDAIDPDYDDERKIDVVCIGCEIRLTDEYQLGLCDQSDGPVCSMCDESRRGVDVLVVRRFRPELVIHSMTAPGEDGRSPGGEL